MKKVLFCLTLLLLCLDCAWAAELPDSVKDAVPPEAADILPEMDTSASHETLWQGLGDLWHSACAYIRTALETQASGAALLLGVVLLCSLAESCLAAADSPCVPRYVSVAGALAITLVAAGDFRRMMGLGVETMSQMEVFSKALLPTLSAAVAAGGYITAGARQVATVFFTDLLISLIRQVLLPLLYACIAAAAADAVVPGHSLQKRSARALRKCAAWALTALMLVFTGFLSVTGAATSAADALSHPVDAHRHRHSGAGGGLHHLRCRRHGAGRCRDAEGRHRRIRPAGSAGHLPDALYHHGRAVPVV